MAWSRNQQIALAILPKISSLFSLFGSIWIVIEVLTHRANSARVTGTTTQGGLSSRHRPKRKHPYHRMLMAMSIYDILESIWNFTSTWPMPKDDNDEIRAIWSVGNTQTCSTQGFFLTLSVAVPIYNALLGVFYMLVIKYQYTDVVLRKWVEPIIHCIAGFWAFGTALTAGFMGMFNNANLWCWIASYPSDCFDTLRYNSGDNSEPNPNPCIRGDNAWLYRWIFYFGPLWVCIFTATVCTVGVYIYVKRLDERTLRYRNPHRHHANNNKQKLPRQSRIQQKQQQQQKQQAQRQSAGTVAAINSVRSAEVTAAVTSDATNNVMMPPTRQHRQASFPDIISNSLRNLSSYTKRNERDNEHIAAAASNPLDDKEAEEVGIIREHEKDQALAVDSDDDAPLLKEQSRTNRKSSSTAISSSSNKKRRKSTTAITTRRSTSKVMSASFSKRPSLQMLDVSDRFKIEEEDEEEESSALSSIDEPSSSDFNFHGGGNDGNALRSNPSPDNDGVENDPDGSAHSDANNGIPKVTFKVGLPSESSDGDTTQEGTSRMRMPLNDTTRTTAASSTDTGDDDDDNNNKWNTKLQRNEKRRNSAMELRDESMSDELLGGRRIKSHEEELYEQQQVMTSSWNNFHIAESLRNKVEEWQKKRQIYRDDYPRTVDVLNQAMWYLGVFYITHIWSTSNRIVQLLNLGETQFWLILFHSWFDPFQGFLNYVVYQRPRYLFIRESQPELGRIGAIRRALMFSYIKQREVDDAANASSSGFNNSINSSGTTTRSKNSKNSSSLGAQKTNKRNHSATSTSDDSGNGNGRIIRGYTGRNSSSSRGGATNDDGDGSSNVIRGFTASSRESMMSQLSIGAIPEESSELGLSPTSSSAFAQPNVTVIPPAVTPPITQESLASLCASFKFDENGDIIEDDDDDQSKDGDDNGEDEEDVVPTVVSRKMDDHDDGCYKDAKVEEGDNGLKASSSVTTDFESSDYVGNMSPTKNCSTDPSTGGSNTSSPKKPYLHRQNSAGSFHMTSSGEIVTGDDIVNSNDSSRNSSNNSSNGGGFIVHDNNDDDATGIGSGDQNKDEKSL